MDTKLTLKMNRRVIRRAKRYAKANQDSLSRLVEKFFNSLTAEEKPSTENPPPIVKSLIGVAKSGGRVDIKKDYADYLDKKYR